MTRLWLQGFFTTLFSQFLQAAALIAIHVLIGAIAQRIYPAYHALPDSDDTTLLWVLVIAEYWLVIRIPSLLGGPTTNMLVSFGGAISQALQVSIAKAQMDAQLISSIGLSVVGTGIAGIAGVVR